MPENIEDMAERVIELETKLAFQEQTVEELHEVIYRQQGQLDELAGELTRLKNRLGEILPEGQAGGGDLA
ncbi:MAG TPA: SlyX family protein [Desulfurivibrionaceae bacterium]|nr:SlyX family protein [Desulfurivibrionaceae bacterium]